MDETTPGRHGLLLISITVAVSMFVVNLDSAILTTSLPQIATNLGVRAVQLSSAITAYVLAMAGFLPLSGWLADRYGTRRVFIWASAIFTMASLGCGLAHTLTELILARVVQGIGGALMTPVGRALVLRHARKENLLDAIATITWPGLFAPVLGPILGAFITTWFSWRWNFLLNVPLGLGVIALARRYVPDDTTRMRQPLDLPGLVLTSTALFCLLYSLENYASGRSTARTVITLGALGALTAAAAIAHFARAQHPLLDLGAYRIPTFRITTGLIGLIARVPIAATPFILPLLLQTGFDLTPIQSGTYIMVYFLGNLLMKPATSPLLRAFGFRRILVASGVVSGLAIAAGALVSPLQHPGVLGALLFVTGLARSMQFTGLNALGFADVTAAHRQIASTLFSMVAQLATALGVASAALLLQKSAVWHEVALPGLPDFRVALNVLGAIGVLASLMFLRLHRDAGAEVSGHAS